MHFEGSIAEQVEHFDPKDKYCWSQGQSPWLVTDPAYRFKYCRVDNDMRPVLGAPYDFGRPHYFTTAWFIHLLQNKFDAFWHERYKLGLTKQIGKYAVCNREIETLLGRNVVARLHAVNNHFPKAFAHAKPRPNALVEFKDPDVVAYREPGSFGFYEIKGSGEGFQFLQLESLALLKAVVPNAEVAVVRMIENGKPYIPRNHPYSFHLDLDD